MSDVTSEDADGMDFAHYWSVICLRKWWIIALCVVITGGAFEFISVMKPVYTATTELLIGAQQAKTVAIRDVYTEGGATSSYRVSPYQTQMKVLQSRQLLEKVIEQLQLLSRVEFKPEPGEKQRQRWLETYFGLGDELPVTDVLKLENMVQGIKKGLVLNNIPSTSLISITFESGASDLAAAVPNMLAQIYIQNQAELRNQKVTEATEWMQGRTVILKGKFEKSQLALQHYIEKEKLVNIGSGDNGGVDSLVSEELRSLTEGVMAAQLKVSELSLSYGAKHPKLLSARSELARTEAALQKQKREIRVLGRKNIKLQELKQNMEAAKALYEKFANRTSEVLETATLKADTIRIVEPAVAPAYPIKPNKPKLLMVAFVGSLLFGIAIFILLDMMNSSIRTVKDIEEKLKQPVLGMLPLLKVRRGKQPNVASAMVDAVNAVFSEAMSTIRTGLILSGLDNPHKVILVTSSVPNEGKTTAAISLAISLGRMEKVLLIDSDMRQPSINRWCRIDRDKLGLSDFVAGGATLKECIVKRDDMGVDLLVAGRCPPNPLELLSSERFGRLLIALEEHYDRIIIDSPPVQAVSDSLVLSQYAKSVIYVVKADSTRTSVVKAGIRRLQEFNAPITGVVLNQVEIKKVTKYGDEHGGYFDQYGYGTKALEADKTA